MNDLFNTYPDVVSIDEIQQMLRIGKNAVYELLKTQKLKSIKVGKKYIVPKKYVIEFLLSNKCFRDYAKIELTTD